MSTVRTGCVAAALTVAMYGLAVATPVERAAGPWTEQALSQRRAGLTEFGTDGRPVRIIAIYGRTDLPVGRAENYRARIAVGAEQPVVYRWSMGDGTLAAGNNVTHRYEQPGRYRVVVTARNRRGTDSDTTYVTVTSVPPASVIADEEGVSAGYRASGSAATGSEIPATVGERPPSPPRPVDVALRGGSIDWSQGGYGLLVATRLESRGAEAEALRFRRAGYRVGIVTDDEGRGSTAYRVLLGQFATPEAAVEGRRIMLGQRLGGAFIVHPLPRGAD